MKITKETKNEDGSVTLDLELTDEEDESLKFLAKKHNCTEDEAIQKAIEWYLREDAKKQVLKYYQENGGEDLYPSDVADKLDLPSLTVFELTEELKDEGLLE